jgi:hypothetical protein
MHTPTNLIADARRADLVRDAIARHTTRDRPRRRDRLAARWRRYGLDGALAGHAVAPARAGLVLRARTLAEPAVRGALGRQLRGIVDDARRGQAPPRVRICPNRSDVLAAAQELDALADRLLSPDPVAAQGVAQVRLLLTVGTGPLYRRGAAGDVRAALTRALACLHSAPDPLP